MDKHVGAVAASVTGFLKKIYSDKRKLKFRKIDEGDDAIYYLAPVRVTSERNPNSDRA